MALEGDDSPDSSSRRVELYVRSLSYPVTYGQRGSVVERLEELKSAGRISEFDVTVWGRELVISGTTVATETGRRLIDRYRTVQLWTEREPDDVDSPFEVKRVDSRITGERYTAVVFPVAVMAEFVDDELVHVAPCLEDGVSCSVMDRLDALESGGDAEEHSLGRTVDSGD
jgi:hypothetical protein